MFDVCLVNEHEMYICWQYLLIPTSLLYSIIVLSLYVCIPADIMCKTLTCFIFMKSDVYMAVHVMYKT